MASVCDFCQTEKASNRVFKLDGRKIRNEGLSEESFKFAFSSNYSYYSLSICESCLLIVTKFIRIKQNLAKSQTQINEVSSHRSRSASPVSKRFKSHDQTPRQELSNQNSNAGAVKRRLFDHLSYTKPAFRSYVDEDSGAEKNSGVIDKTTFREVVPAHIDVNKYEDLKNELQRKRILISILQGLSSVKRGTSCLFEKGVDQLSSEDQLTNAANELENKVPFLYEVLNTALPEGNTATIGMIYGMVMHARNMQASAIQRILTTVCINADADNKLLGRFNKLHITLTGESRRTLINEMSSKCEERIVKAVATGADGKINGDNVDLYVKTNDVRMNNSNKDYHFFASDWTIHRLKKEDFQSNQYLIERLRSVRPEVALERFLPSDEEIQVIKSSVIVLIGRLLCKNLPSFKWLELILPKHIEHALQKEMSKKSQSFLMPILLKNEANYADCVQIMASYVEQTSNWYDKAGRGADYDRLCIPVGGDQLTRVRLDGAKSLRAGSHTKKERLENLFPVIIELFHTLMDFVEKLYKTFMKDNSARDSGTMAHLKTVLSRSSVNGKVKSRFQAHEDFADLVGKSYVLEAARTHFKMIDGKPTNPVLPDNIENLHKANRTKIMNELLEPFVDEMFGPCSVDEELRSNSLFVLVNDTEVIKCKVEDEQVTIPFKVGETDKVLITRKSRLDNGQKIKILFPNVPVVIIEKAKGDDLYSYTRYFLSLYVLIICLKDAISEGDITRIKILLKFFIPHFYTHSTLSKYLVECLDYVLKVEMLLPHELAVQVQAGGLVNPNGGAGNNRPADMQKEHQVKKLKSLIKALGANKTETSIIKISKAAPVIDDVISVFDRQVGFKTIRTNHHKRNDSDDLQMALTCVSKLEPFVYKNGRELRSYKNICSNVFSKLKPSANVFKLNIMSIVERLRRGFPVENDEQEDDENDAQELNDEDNFDGDDYDYNDMFQSL